LSESENGVWHTYLLDSQQAQISIKTQNEDEVALLQNFLQVYDLKTCLCTSLRAQDEFLGVLLIWRNYEEQFTSADKRLVALFTNQASLALYNAKLHEQNRQLAIEQERTRLAQNLHDTVAQSLYSIGMATRTALKLLEQGRSEDQLRQPIAYASDLSRNALSEMRQTIYQLVPASLMEIGLVDVLSQHCQTLTSNYGLTIDMNITPDLTLSNEYQETLFYIIKEALWNIVKHANATRVTVELTSSQDNNGLALFITDNGIGFEPTNPIPAYQFGLKNMQARANRFGGTFKLRSQKQKGTQIQVELPLLTDIETL
jgi:signal transduction histidine kinase